MVWPFSLRNVVVPLLLVVAVPVVRPEPSRNVLVPLLSVVTGPVVRSLASRNVVWFYADAAVIMVSVRRASCVSSCPHSPASQRSAARPYCRPRIKAAVCHDPQLDQRFLS